MDTFSLKKLCRAHPWTDAYMHTHVKGKGVAALSALFTHFQPHLTAPTPPRCSLKRLPLILHSPLKASSMLIRAKHNIRFPSAALQKGLKACTYMCGAKVLFVSVKVWWKGEILKIHSTLEGCSPLGGWEHHTQ